MKKIYALVMMLSFCFFALPNYASAETQDLVVRLNFNANQVEGTTDYFNMNVEGGETLRASFTMTNNSSENMTVKIEPTNAITGCYGNINYTTETEVPNAWIDEGVALANNIEIENKVMIPANSTVEVPFTVSVPESTGTLLGGFRIYVQGTEDTANSGSVEITTKTEQVYGLQLNYPKVEEEKVSNHYVRVEGNTLYVHIQNERNTVTDGVHATVIVEDKDGNLVFEYEIQPFKMAPNSTIEYPVTFEGELESGMYNIGVSLNGEEVQWHEVKVTKDSNTVTSETVENPSVSKIESDRHFTWVFVLIAVVTIIMKIRVNGKRNNNLSKESNQEKKIE